jgi:hypothetical protein
MPSIHNKEKKVKDATIPFFCLYRCASTAQSSMRVGAYTLATVIELETPPTVAHVQPEN